MPVTEIFHRDSARLDFLSLNRLQRSTNSLPKSARPETMKLAPGSYQMGLVNSHETYKSHLITPGDFPQELY